MNAARATLLAIVLGSTAALLPCSAQSVTGGPPPISAQDVATPKTRPMPATTDCAAFSRAITESEQTMSMLKAEAVGDNSAPRAAVREQQVANQLTLASANLSLMARANCTLPTLPISLDAYPVDAIMCYGDLLRSRSGSPLPASCNRAAWKRSNSS